MKQFKYKAKKGPEEVVQGTLVAASKDEAIDKINDMGLLPVDLFEAGENEEREEKAAPSVPKFRLKKIKAHDLSIFTRQLATLVKSGVPILRALVLIGDQTIHLELQKTIRAIHEQVRHGNHLSEAMQEHRQIFSSLDIAMVQAGESSGRLDEALLRIAKYKEEEERIFSKVRSAIAYPLFVMGVGFTTVIFMLVYVIPKFSDFFSDLGQQLPWPTRFLLGFAAWMQMYWWIILLLFAGTFLLIHQLTKQPSQKFLWDKFFLSVPKFGSLALKGEIVRFSRSLELLLKSGIQLLTAIKITLPVIGNDYLRAEIERSYQVVADGGYLSEGLRSSGAFPAFVCQLANIGEESGKLDEALSEIAFWYEQEIEEQIKIMTQLLEPAVIIVVGAILGLMIVAVLLPVFSINALIQ